MFGDVGVLNGVVFLVSVGNDCRIGSNCNSGWGIVGCIFFIVIIWLCFYGLIVYVSLFSLVFEIVWYGGYWFVGKSVGLIEYYLVYLVVVMIGL